MKGDSNIHVQPSVDTKDLFGYLEVMKRSIKNAAHEQLKQKNGLLQCFFIFCLCGGLLCHEGNP